MGNIVEKKLKSGAVSYKARVRRKGHPTVSKTFKRKTDAKKWLSLVESKILEGRGLPKPRKTTFSQAIDRYILEVMPSKKPNTHAVELSRLHFWKKELGHMRLVEIDYDILIKARKTILETPIVRKGRKDKQKRGPATANRYMALLRHVFSVAMREWGLVDMNPVTKVRALKESPGRERILTDAELKILLEGLEMAKRQDFKLIVKIALLTGCRRSNAERLHWEHIDFKNQTVLFPDTKNNRPHVAPITAEMCKELKGYQAKMCAVAGPVFPSKPGSKNPYVDVKQVWRQFTKLHELEGLRFHDLRHAVASYLVQQQVPLYSVGKLLGHRSLQSTQRYAHLGVSDMAPFVEQLGNRLRGVK